MYTRLTGRSLKAHIHSFSTDKTVCGRKRWDMVPFTLNKTKYDVKTMFMRHLGVAKRRGYPNPYKWVCMACLDKMRAIVEESLTKQEIKEIEKIEKGVWIEDPQKAKVRKELLQKFKDIQKKRYN